MIQSRREFIRNGSVFAAMMAAAPTILHAEGAQRVFKVGLVGCGGRGNGAFQNLMNAGKQLNVKIELAATADFFEDKAKSTAKKWGCDEKFAFSGANGYKKIMGMKEIEIVILTTPLNFRAVHLAAAVAAGKHVFAEKGVAVDGPGVRLFIEASKQAAAKHLTIVAGTQRRHQRGYRLQAKALQEGKLAPILGGAVYWNGSVPWVHKRQTGMSNAEYLASNWLNFTELSGDHICEQHVHNIDVANWFIGRLPKTALGFGGRARRVTGNQFDFFSIDFDYGDGVHIHSSCRQIKGCSDRVAELFRTPDAIISGGGRIERPGDKHEVVKLEGDFMEGNAYDIEHVDLLKSIMGTGPYYNEGEQVALSTACGVIGRISAYTGEMVRLSDILTNKDSKFYNLACKPTPVDFENGEVELPKEEPAVPGVVDPRFV